MDATTIGVDLAKTVFELALANPAWRIVGRKRLTRLQFERFIAMQPTTHVVMEACGRAHHWARIARGHGHRVTLLPAQYVRPYVRRNKTDRIDAEALLEALRSGRIDPVVVKTVAQQELQALHRVRAEWMATRTARISAMRGFLQEHGLAIARGARTVATIPSLIEDDEVPLPSRLRAVLAQLMADVMAVERNLIALERYLAAIATADPVVGRLMTIPGIGLITGTALVATVGQIHGFRSARRFASWLGLTPSERSSAHRRRLGAISKMGDVYLRCLLTHGARAVLLASPRAAHERRRPLMRLQQWALSVQGRRGHNKATVAIANQLARIAWAVWSREVPYEDRPAISIAA